MTDPKIDPFDSPRAPEHKLQLWIPDELFFEMGEYFSYGTRKAVFTRLAVDILEIMKKTKNPEFVCEAILSGKLRLGKEFKGDDHAGS